VDRAADGRPVRMSGTGQDVTDERAAQDAARELTAARAARAAAEEGRRRLEAVLEGIGEAFVAVDGEWRYTMLNTRAVEAIGRPREEVLGRSVWEVFPESVGGEAWRELHRVRAEGRPASFELRSTLLDRWLAMHVAPWKDGLSIFYEDVTDRREAQETRARLAAIVESSGDAIFSKTLEGIVTSWNRGAERLYGYTAGEMVGRPVALLAPPERVDEIPAILRRISRGERVDTFETVRRRKDGTLVDVLLAVSPVADAGGTVVGASTIARDVTERKRTEARLRESEESLRFLAEASRVLASSLDLRGTLAAVLRLGIPRLGDFCSMYLVDEEGRARAVGSAHVDPGREPLLAELVSGFTPRPGGETPVSRVLSTGEAVLTPEVDETALEAAVGDDEARRRLHALAPRSLVAVPLKSEGRTVGVMSFAMGDSGRRHSPADLALAEEVARRAAVAVENARLHGAEREARRAAEAAAARTARLQAVTAALSEARTPAEVADVVIREGFTSLGAVAGWLMELDAAGEMLEVLRSAGYPDDVVARFHAFPVDAPVPLADAVRTGEPVFLESPAERARRYPALSRDFDGLGYGAWVSVPLVAEGRPTGGIGLTVPTPRVFDAEQREFVAALARQCAMALERARLFEAERRARTEAEAANRAKFEFLTTMSHELRTPLNAIAGYVELLELEIRGPLNEAQHEYLAKVRRSQTHLLGLINDVLNFARIETGHVHFDLGDVPLDETLAEIETLIAPQVQARGLTYEYRRSDAGCTVRADVEKLRQIVLNLLSNAVKFTPSGGRIVMECGSGADGVVEVRVRDTGVGIPADKLATIFEPFVQVNSGYTRPSEGTGLGLSISRDLARAMGGDLLVESRDGEGSVFTLTLPTGGAPSGEGDALTAEARTA
jgi:PAS domain S-box-containing protein